MCTQQGVTLKRGTTGLAARIMTGLRIDGPQNGMSRQKRDGWQPYLEHLSLNDWNKLLSYDASCLGFQMQWMHLFTRHGHHSLGRTSTT